MGADKEPHVGMLHYGYGILVRRDCSMGMVPRCIPGVPGYNGTSRVDCAAAIVRIHVSIYWQIARSAPVCRETAIAPRGARGSSNLIICHLFVRFGIDQSLIEHNFVADLTGKLSNDTVV